MTNDRHEKTTRNKLVKNRGTATLDYISPKHRSTKKRVHKQAIPYLRPHKVKGHIYYSYCWGTDREIYLGDADTILHAVKGV